MTHQNLYDQIYNYQPHFKQEITFKNRMLGLITQYPNCLERSCLHAHFTASAWVINQAKTHCVLLHHKKLNRWFQPGGHADGNSNLWEVAKTEVAEETGLDLSAFSPSQIFDIDIHEIPERSNVPKHFHYDVRFLFVLPGLNKLTQNHESNQVKWVDLQEVKTFNTDESILRMVEKTYNLL